MQPSQDQIFATSEADNWFERNREALNIFNPDSDLSLKVIELYNLQPHRVLEVGAANGFRLAVISERYGAKTVALDPSLKAIKDGHSKYPAIEVVRGQAYAIPLQDLFDFVIVSFVFCWIDRNNLLRSVAEIDRLLKDGGFLIISDFFPSNLIKVKYHHLVEQEVYTYKQSYAEPFLASGLYHPVCLLTNEHSSKTLAAEVTEDKRTGTWLLRKMINDHYAAGSFPLNEGRALHE